MGNRGTRRLHRQRSASDACLQRLLQRRRAAHDRRTRASRRGLARRFHDARIASRALRGAPRAQRSTSTASLRTTPCAGSAKRRVCSAATGSRYTHCTPGSVESTASKLSRAAPAGVSPRPPAPWWASPARQCERTREALSQLAAERACRYRSVVVIREWPWRSSPRRGRRRRRRAAIRTCGGDRGNGARAGRRRRGRARRTNARPGMSRAGSALFAAAATEHPAHIPQEVAGSSRRHPPIPATPRSKSPALAGNPCLSPLSPKAP